MNTPDTSNSQWMATATEVHIDEPSIDAERRASGDFTHDELVLLISYMAESGRYTTNEVAYAVQKPWKFAEEYAEAEAERDEEGSREILPLEQQYPKVVKPLPDKLVYPVSGVTRCYCGAKYWDVTTCASCGVEWDGTDQNSDVRS